MKAKKFLTEKIPKVDRRTILEQGAKKGERSKTGRNSSTMQIEGDDKGWER
jgi:hypothetical protein